MSKKLLALISLLLLAAVMLTACGGQASPATTTISVTATQQPDIYKCGAMRFPIKYPCNGNIATIKISDNVTVLVDTEASYIKELKQAPITFDAQIVDADGNYMRYAYCTWNGSEYTNPTINTSLLSVVDSQYNEIKCFDHKNADIYFTGTFVVPVQSYLIATMTALPSPTLEPFVPAPTATP